MNPFYTQQKNSVTPRRKKYNKRAGSSSSMGQCSSSSGGVTSSTSARHFHDVNAATVYKQENFDICLLNARSVMSDKKGADFKSFVEDSPFPIYAVTETWLPNAAATDQSFGPDLPNYTWLGQVGRANKPGGGVAWCVQDDLFHKIKVVDTGLPLSDDYQVSHIQFDGLDLFCVYVVPGMKLGNHEEIFDYMSNFNDRNAVFLGDFNLPGVDFVEGKTSGGRASSIFDHFCDKVTFQQLVKEPTRDSNVLDLVFSSGPEVVDHVQVIPHVNRLHGWDHRPVQVTLTRFVESKSDFKVSIKDFKKMDKDLFLTTLKHADWSGADPNALQIKIRENLQEAIAVSIPSKEISFKKLLKQRQTSEDTIAASKLAAKLHRIYRQCPSVTNYNNYLDVNALRRALQRRDDDNYATTRVTKDAKSFWSFINRSTNKHRGIPTLVEKGVEVDDDQGKADLFAEGFMDVYKEKKLFTGPYEPTDPSTRRMPDFTFNIEKTRKAIKHMKANSAPGVDGIGAKFYKLAIDIVSEPLTRLFQLSYDTGIVPEEWKESTITALYKNKGPRNSKSSYRPISLLLVSFKLMEKSMKFDLCGFFDANELWSPCQHAFRSRRSTLTCLLEATDQVERWLDDPNTMYAAYISLDAMKAFDAVTFDKLGRSLVDQGLPEKGVRWFLAGLSDRRFRVKVGGAFSCFKSPGSGIQQGAILSPICWNLHMQTLQAIVHDIPGAQAICKLHIYADDVCLSARIRSPTDEDILQQVLTRYEEVALEKSMHVHPEKSQLLRIGKRSDTQFTIGGKIIPEVEQMEALGVVLAANNKNDAHFQKVLKKVRQRVFLLRKSVQSTDVVVRTIVWDLMMGSIIRYGYPAVKEFNLTQLRKLQSLQRLWMSRVRSCALTCKHRRKRLPALSLEESQALHTIPCPKHVGPSPVFQTLAEEDLMVYYDLCTGKMNADVPLPSYTKRNIRTRKSALGGFLDPPPIANATRSKAYMHRIIKLVNSLPVNLRVGLEEIRDWKSSVKPNTYLFCAPKDGMLSRRLDDAHSIRKTIGRRAAFNAWAGASLKAECVPTDKTPRTTPSPALPPNQELPVGHTGQEGTFSLTEFSPYWITRHNSNSTNECRDDFQNVWIFPHMQAVSIMAPASHRLPLDQGMGAALASKHTMNIVLSTQPVQLDVASSKHKFSVEFVHESQSEADTHSNPGPRRADGPPPRSRPSQTRLPRETLTDRRAQNLHIVSMTFYIHTELLSDLESYLSHLLESLRGREISHMQAVSMALITAHRIINFGTILPLVIDPLQRPTSLDVAYAWMHYEITNVLRKLPMNNTHKGNLCESVRGLRISLLTNRDTNHGPAAVLSYKGTNLVSTTYNDVQGGLLDQGEWPPCLQQTMPFFRYLHMQAASKFIDPNRRILESNVTHHEEGFQAPRHFDNSILRPRQLSHDCGPQCSCLPFRTNICSKSCHSKMEMSYSKPLRNLILDFAFLSACHSSTATKKDNSIYGRPKLSSPPAAAGEIVPVFGTVNNTQSQLTSTRDNKSNKLSNALKNIPSLCPVPAPLATPPSFHDEAKKFLSREAFKRGVRQDSDYRRPPALDLDRYRTCFALQSIQEIKGKSTFLLAGNLSELSTVRSRPNPSFL